MSIVEQNKIGWTIDPAKRTDMILYIVKPTWEARWLPYPQLRDACRELLAGPLREARVFRAGTRDDRGRVKYHTDNVGIEWATLYDAMGMVDPLAPKRIAPPTTPQPEPPPRESARQVAFTF